MRLEIAHTSDLVREAMSSSEEARTGGFIETRGNVGLNMVCFPACRLSGLELGCHP
jgi:hypothetical protein